MFNFLDLVRSFLPLTVQTVSWDGDTLIISSDSWSFRTESVWRIMEDNKIGFTCWDKSAKEIVKNIQSTNIVDISWLIPSQDIDLSFLLSNKKRLDIFSTLTLEPWIFTLPDGNIYIGNS